MLSSISEANIGIILKICSFALELHKSQILKKLTLPYLSNKTHKKYTEIKLSCRPAMTTVLIMKLSISTSRITVLLISCYDCIYWFLTVITNIKVRRSKGIFTQQTKWEFRVQKDAFRNKNFLFNLSIYSDCDL